MSSSTNPYTLGGWPTPQQTTRDHNILSLSSAFTFRIVHPSALCGGASTTINAPVDILNCVVLDPYGRKYLSTGTREVLSSTWEASSGDATITSIHDPQGRVVGQVEWCLPHPIVQLNHTATIPRQKSSYIFFESTLTIPDPPPHQSAHSLFVNATLHTWVKCIDEGPGKYKLYSYDNERRPVQEVEVSQQRNGELEVKASEAGVKGGLVDASLIALLFRALNRAAS